MKIINILIFKRGKDFKLKLIKFITKMLGMSLFIFICVWCTRQAYPADAIYSYCAIGSIILMIGLELYLLIDRKEK